MCDIGPHEIGLSKYKEVPICELNVAEYSTTVLFFFYVNFISTQIMFQWSLIYCTESQPGP
jgi:hypothetical protein